MIDQMQSGEERLTLPSRSRLRASLPFALYVVPVLILALAVRVFRRGVADLALDEAISYFIASQSPLEIVRYTMGHVFEHPPGYYLLLHAWMSVAGSSEVALRYLSALGGVATVGLMAAVAYRWFGRRVAFLAALLMALQPLAAGFGYFTRMYSWLHAIALLGVYLLDRALRCNRWRDWLLFVAALGLGILFHYLIAAALLALALFLLLRWRALGPARTRFALVLALLVGVPLLWIAVSSGPRDSLLMVARRAIGEGWYPSRLSTIYTEWAMGSAMENLPRGQVPLLSAVPWLFFLGGVVAMARPRAWQRRDLQLLILLLVLVPPVAGSMLFTVVASRHHSAMLGIFVLGAALAIDALFRYRRAAGAVALVLLAAYDGVLVRDYVRQGEWRPFSAPIQYIEDRAGAGDTLAFTYFLDWTWAGYYKRQDLPIVYAPTDDRAPTDAEAAATAARVLDQGRPVWLMLYPSVWQPERLEQAFNRLAFPADKLWFPGGRGVVRYFPAQPMTGQPGGLKWEAGIRLDRWAISSTRLAAGDALRLRFDWQADGKVAERGLVALSLYGPDGLVWATRLGEPCNGWCPTTDWGNAAVVDRQALLVPSDVPPGDYELRIAWLTPEGQPMLGQDGSGAPQVELPLAPAVHVEPPLAPVPPAPPDGRALNAAAGPGLTLASAQLAAGDLRPGATVQIPARWQVSAAQPALELQLRLERDGQAVTLSQPLGPEWYPSQSWGAGRAVRTQPRFTLPGTLAPGSYRVSLAVGEPGSAPRAAPADLGALTIVDRPHRFDLPAGGAQVDASWEEGIRLARVAAAGAAQPGSRLDVQLTWQAGRPTGGNWKVFVHLLGSDGQTLAQHDAYPAGGEAPTSTWQPGEVIVDTHTLELPPDLPAGTYPIAVGFYDEPSGARLARQGGGDTFLLPDRVVVP